MPTSDIMHQLEMFATQTVMATMGITNTVPIAPVEGTLVPGVDQQPAGGEQPTQAPAGGEQPAEPPAGGEQPTEAPAGGEQPTQAPAGGEQPTQAPAGGVQPTQPPAELVVPTGIPTIQPPNEYTLQTGEYIYCIARRFDINPADLLAANGLNTASVVYAGLTLTIPQTSNPFPGQRAILKHPATYTVNSGETIYSVACKYGDVTPEAIAYANNLQSPYTLQAGQQLIIP
jgi:LysM repeat protein